MSTIVEKIEGSEVVGRVVIVDINDSELFLGSNKFEDSYKGLSEARKTYLKDQDTEILFLTVELSSGWGKGYIALTLADAKALRDSLGSMITYIEAEEV